MIFGKLEPDPATPMKSTPPFSCCFRIHTIQSCECDPSNDESEGPSSSGKKGYIQDIVVPFFRDLTYFLGLKAFKQRTSQRGWSTPPTQKLQSEGPWGHMGPQACSSSLHKESKPAAKNQDLAHKSSFLTFLGGKIQKLCKSGPCFLYPTGGKSWVAPASVCQLTNVFPVSRSRVSCHLLLPCLHCFLIAENHSPTHPPSKAEE